MKCNPKWQLSRRTIGLGLISSPLVLLYPTQPAQARVKGAAEYDLEYYIKDLTRSVRVGRSRSGESSLSTTPAAQSSDSCRTPSTHLLNGPLPTICINAILSSVSHRSPNFKSLLQEYALAKGDTLTRTFVSRCGGDWIGVSSMSTSSLVQPFLHEHEHTNETKDGGGYEYEGGHAVIKDQRHFDYLCYLIWKVAGGALGKSEERLEVLRSAGETINKYITTVTTPNPPTSLSPTTKNNACLSTTVESAFTPVLTAFVSSNLIESYTLQSGDGKARSASPSTSSSPPTPNFKPFDVYDDEDYDVGRDVNMVLEVKKPAWLTSALQINGENSLFSPSLLSPTLSSSILETEVSLRPVQSYFIDDTYRPNPTEFYPSSEILQFTFYKK